MAKKKNPIIDIQRDFIGKIGMGTPIVDFGERHALVFKMPSSQPNTIKSMEEMWPFLHCKKGEIHAN